MTEGIPQIRGSWEGAVLPQTLQRESRQGWGSRTSGVGRMTLKRRPSDNVWPPAGGVLPPEQGEVPSQRGVGPCSRGSHAESGG